MIKKIIQTIQKFIKDHIIDDDPCNGCECNCKECDCKNCQCKSIENIESPFKEESK